MAPSVAEDVDCYTIPHARIKKLVYNYSEKLEKTDFGSAEALSGLLQTLQESFKEFKHHERIENKVIIKKLRNKLKERSEYLSAVCHCHKDSELNSILQLVSTGYSKKSIQDRINYGLQLRNTLQQFEARFMPHMEEEEQIFQPLLEKYFTYEELCELRLNVIQLHLEQDSNSILLRDNAEEEQSSESEEDEQDDYCQSVSKYKDKEISTSITELPSELTMHIFSFLNPRDLCRTAQVSKAWSASSMDGSLWKHIHPVKWASGSWDHNLQPEDDLDGLDDEPYTVIDEDADVDEADRSEDEDSSDDIKQLMREARVLMGVNRFLLPKVGRTVSTLDISHSRAVTSTLVNNMLRQCPNVQLLNISHTRVSDNALKCLGQGGVGVELRWFRLAGCVNITDMTLMRLALVLNQADLSINCNEEHTITERTLTLSLYDIAPNTTKPQLNSVTQEINQRKTCDKNKKVVNYTEIRAPAETLSTCHTNKHSACHATCATLPNITQCARKGPDKCIEDCANYTKNETFSDATHPLPKACSRTRSGPDSSCSSCSATCSLSVYNSSNDNTCDNKTVDNCGCRKLPELTLQSRTCGEQAARPEQDRCGQCADVRCTDLKPSQLRHIDLSGCYQITDCGIGHLAFSGPLPALQHLDLSGCSELTGPALHSLVGECPALLPENLSYCENIEDGPYEDEASGCMNLGCNSRFCCRVGD